MALLSVIRRWHFRDGIAIREIVRRTGLSRNTVRKYLSSGDVEPSYPKRKMPSKLDAYEATLRCWLQRESFLRRKDRRCIGEVHVDLVCLGYSGSYDRVAAFARQWREEQRKAADLAGKGVYVPLFFAPGEAFQFDWSEEWMVVGGRRTKLQVAQFKLCFSRAFMLRAYPLQTHEMLYDAHNHALAALGGVPDVRDPRSALGVREERLYRASRCQDRGTGGVAGAWYEYRAQGARPSRSRMRRSRRGYSLLHTELRIHLPEQT